MAGLLQPSQLATIFSEITELPELLACIGSIAPSETIGAFELEIFGTDMVATN